MLSWNQLISKGTALLKRQRRLRLYQTHYCPYCIMVRDAAAELGIVLELVNVDRDREALRSLMQRRGRGTVPVLGIPDDEGEEALLPESRDIIRYLREIEQA